MRINSRMLLAPAVAIAATAAIAGCGSSTTTLNKQQVLTAGNAVCSVGNAITDAFPFPHNPTPQQANRIVTSFFVPAIQAQINAITLIGNHSNQKQQVANLMSQAQTALNQVKANPSLLQQNTSPFHSFAAQARAYGLTECAKNA